MIDGKSSLESVGAAGVGIDLSGPEFPVDDRSEGSHRFPGASGRAGAFPRRADLRGALRAAAGYWVSG
jgi:hypothetical protein